MQASRLDLGRSDALSLSCLSSSVSQLVLVDLVGPSFGGGALGRRVPLDDAHFLCHAPGSSDEGLSELHVSPESYILTSSREVGHSNVHIYRRWKPGESGQHPPAGSLGQEQLLHTMNVSLPGLTEKRPCQMNLIAFMMRL